MSLNESRSRNSLETNAGSFTRSHRRDSDNVIIGNKDSSQKTVRFPSSHLTNEDFVRIDSWTNNTPSQGRESDDVPFYSAYCSCLTSIRQWSRKRKFMLVCLIIILLFFVAAAIVLLIILLVNNGNNNNNYHNDIISTTSFPEITTISGSTTPFPYLVGYISKTSSKFVSFGVNLTSFTPDITEYNFNNRLIGWSAESQKILLFDLKSENRRSMNLDILSETILCKSCEILSFLDNSPLTSSSVIYGCKNCVGGDENNSTFYRFGVLGYMFDVYAEPVEVRVMSDRSSLFLTTVNQNSDNCYLQPILVNGSTKYTSLGRPYDCISSNSTTNINISSISTTTKDFLNPKPIESIIDINNNFLSMNINKSEMDPIVLNLDLPLNETFYSSSTFLNNFQHFQTAIIYNTRVYIVRINLTSGCITVLANYYLDFMYDGEWQGGGWIGDLLLIWYRERDGANFVTFDFQWPNDVQC